MAEKTPAQEFLEFAQAQAKKATTAIELHNAIYGNGAKFSQLFPTQRARTLFIESPECKVIKGLLDGLGGYTESGMTPSGKFTVRAPISLHAALIEEAESEGVSLNQLVVAKLAVGLRSALGVTK